MQEDFHYYATYAAACLSGYSPEEAAIICYSAQLVDLCSRTLLTKLRGPKEAATTQLSLEMADARMDAASMQEITRIWASFHFLPGDLTAERKGWSRRYRNKYRLICQPNSDLLLDTVELARGSSLQAAGIAMHVLADTWAHRYFAGTPSLVINNTNYHFYEIMPDNSERAVKFRHSPSAPDDLEQGIYTNSIYQGNENSIMNLGHGRAGHLPDYSFMRYRYLPAWGDYEEVVKDNPTEYYCAFCQMIRAMQYLRGEKDRFAKEEYAWETAGPWEEKIRQILSVRRPDACDDWKALGEKISGKAAEPFQLEKHQKEYMTAAEAEKDGTFLGKFFLAALAQKSMVTNRIYRSGSRLAGFSVDYEEKGFVGRRDFRKLIDARSKKL